MTQAVQARAGDKMDIVPMIFKLLVLANLACTVVQWLFHTGTGQSREAPASWVYPTTGTSRGLHGWTQPAAVAQK